MTGTRRQCALASAVGLALAAAPPASAQERAEREDSARLVEKVEVTGTRLPPPNLQARSPVTVLRAEEIAKDGPLPIEEILSRLPMVLGEQNSMVANGATGTSSVDLRGLGGRRTLVLMNGRRMGAGGTIFVEAPDLNQIPTGLIRRVDVLTGGASAVYGSDAVAGVVNFIMNDRFEGVQGDVSYSFYNHRQQNPQGVADIVASRAVTNPAQFKVPGDKSADGQSMVVNLLMGSDFGGGKGNATVFFGYRDDEALLESERDYSACALGANASGLFCSGSNTSYPGLFLVDPANDGRSLTVANSAGGVRPYVAATDAYNFAPTNYYRRPAQRYNVSVFADYAFSPGANLYTEFGFHDDHTVSQIAESGLFGNSVTVRFENPLLSAEWRNRLRLTRPGDSIPVQIFRRNQEGGGRQADLRHTSYREVIGLRGSFAEHWSYDAFFQLGKVLHKQVYRNDFSISRGVRAMDVVTDPVTGAPVCRAVLDGTDPFCVPYNIWSLGGVTPQALTYLQTPGGLTASNELRVLNATVTADLGGYGLKFPGQEGIAIAAGLERRYQEQVQEAEIAFSSGDLAGQGGSTPSVAGSYTVKEVFGEVRMPVFESLSVNGSYRYSDYNPGQRVDSFGAGFDFSPLKQARLRGSFQRAVRAPSVGELYYPQETQPFGGVGVDPCAGTAPTRSLDDCRRTGVTAAQYGRIVEYPLGSGAANIRVGGNQTLQPEKANTVTVGVVLTPFKDLSATVDYYDIEIEDTIGNASASITFRLCLDTGDPRYCSRVTRDPVGGTLWLPGGQVDATINNLGVFRASGIDAGLNYSHRLDGLGSLAIDALGTYMRHFMVEQYKGTGAYDCAGFFAMPCYQPRPKWRHRVRATWSTPWNWDVSATWRYIDEVSHSDTSSDPALAAAAPNALDPFRKLPAVNYLDLAASRAISKAFTLRGGISNVLDKDPPLFAGAAPQGNGNVWVGTYDSLGRRVWLNLTAKF